MQGNLGTAGLAASGNLTGISTQWSAEHGKVQGQRPLCPKVCPRRSSRGSGDGAGPPGQRCIQLTSAPVLIRNMKNGV